MVMPLASLCIPSFYSTIRYMKYKITTIIEVPHMLDNVSAQEFSELTGLSIPYYHKIKSGQRIIPESTYKQISDALNKRHLTDTK